MGWEEGWVGKKDGLGRRIGWEEGWVGKKDGLGRRTGWEEEYQIPYFNRSFKSAPI